MKYSTLLSGIPLTTVKVTSTDAAQSIADAVTKSSNKSPSSILITCETADIRFAFGSTPTTTLGHILYATYSIVLDNPKAIRDFKFISETAGTHGDLMITPFYEVGSGV